MDSFKPKRMQDGEQNRARKKGKYGNNSSSYSNQAIPLGAVGLLVTCDSSRERKAALLLIPIIEQCYDELSGTEKTPVEDAKTTSDIRSLIEAEVQESKTKDKFRFKFCETGVKGCCFIRFPEVQGGASPQAVAIKLLRQAKATKQLPTPLISRLLPVTHTCHANMDEIQEMAKEIVPLHFPSGEGVEGSTFSIEYEHRSCDKFDRAKVINAFADVVPQPLYKVDLSKPQKTVLVQISRNVCAASVVVDYKTLGKYNIRKVAEVLDESGNISKVPAAPEKDESGQASQRDKGDQRQMDNMNEGMPKGRGG